MKKIFRNFIDFIGNFSLVLVGLIILVSVWLTASLMVYVNQIDNVNIIVYFSKSESFWLMGTCIGLIFIVVFLRINRVNRNIKKRVYYIWRSKHPDNIGSLATKYLPVEKEQRLVSLLSEFSPRGNIFRKLANLIAWHTQPFVLLLFVLIIIGGAMVLCYNSEPLQKDYAHSWLWVSCPWLCVVSIMLYLLINDWLIIRTVTKFLHNLLAISDSSSSSMNSIESNNVPEQLTPTEQIVYTKRRKEGKPIKQIADEMNVSMGTIKTHINNIGKKLNKGVF